MILSFNWKRPLAAFLGIIILGCAPMNAQAAKYALTTWWPDPSTGLMWTGVTRLGTFDWDQAVAYCSAESLDGYLGWRLPTLDEIKDIASLSTWTDVALAKSGERANPHLAVRRSDYMTDLKGGLSGGENFYIWSSTALGEKHGWMSQDYSGFDKSGSLGALCVRTMEPDLLQIAKEAQVDHLVADLPTLKTYVLLRQAQASYEKGDYQAALTGSQQALAQQKALPTQPDEFPTYLSIGICYGMLGQWDLAVTDLKLALKINKNYQPTKIAIKWAEQGQKAAKKGTSPGTTIPVW